MLYTEVLTKNGLTPETVSHGIRVKIKQYLKIFEAIEKAREQLPNVKSARKKVEIESEITAGEENLVTINNALCDSIQKYKDNEELNRRKAENLKEVRDRKNKGGAAPAKTETTPAATPKADDKTKTTPAATVKAEVVVEEPKKKSSFLGVVVGVVVVGVLAALGVRHYKNKE